MATIVKGHESIIRVFLGGPDAPRPDLDLLQTIGETIKKTYGKTNEQFNLRPFRWREPPDLIQDIPGQPTAESVQAQRPVGEYEIVGMIFRDSLGSPGPDGHISWSTYELHCALEAQKRSKLVPTLPIIQVYKAPKSWEPHTEQYLSALPKDAEKAVEELDRKLRNDHSELVRFLHELKGRSDRGSAFGFMEYDQDDKLFDAVLRSVRTHFD